MSQFLKPSPLRVVIATVHLGWELTSLTLDKSYTGESQITMRCTYRRVEELVGMDYYHAHYYWQILQIIGTLQNTW